MLPQTAARTVVARFRNSCSVRLPGCEVTSLSPATPEVSASIDDFRASHSLNTTFERVPRNTYRDDSAISARKWGTHNSHTGRGEDQVLSGFERSVLTGMSVAAKFRQRLDQWRKAVAPRAAFPVGECIGDFARTDKAFLAANRLKATRDR
jgi:hypothetical protein